MRAPSPDAGAHDGPVRLGGGSGLLAALGREVGGPPTEAPPSEAPPEPRPWVDDLPWAGRPFGARPIPGTEDALGRPDYQDLEGRLFRPDVRAPVRPEAR